MTTSSSYNVTDKDQGCVSQKHRKPKLIVEPMLLGNAALKDLCCSNTWTTHKNIKFT